MGAATSRFIPAQCTFLVPSDSGQPSDSQKKQSADRPESEGESNHHRKECLGPSVPSPMATQHMNKQDDPITRAFLGQAMKVHSWIGPGLDEEIYHQELVSRLTAAGIEHLSKPRRDLVYRGHVADTFEPDFVIGNHFIPELKCLRGGYAPEHLLQLFCYCKFWRLRIGMLMDFGKESLSWRRHIYRSKTSRLPTLKLPSFIQEPALAMHLLGLVRECLAETGLGYRETTWKGLVIAALLAGGHEIIQHPSADVGSRGVHSMRCLVVDQTCAISVTALTDGLGAADRAALQTRLRWLGLEWGLLLHFGKNTADAQFVRAPTGRSIQ